MHVRSDAMRFIVVPLALVHITISVDETALAERVVIFPKALVRASILPDPNSLALHQVRGLFTAVSDPFAGVLAAIAED